MKAREKLWCLGFLPQPSPTSLLLVLLTSPQQMLQELHRVPRLTIGKQQRDSRQKLWEQTFLQAWALFKS